MTHAVALAHEESHDYLGTVALVDYPMVGDVVMDEDGAHWLVSGRIWKHAVGLILLVRPSHA